MGRTATRGPLLAVGAATLALGLAWGAGAGSDAPAGAARDTPGPAACDGPPPPLRPTRRPLPAGVATELPALTAPAGGPPPRGVAESLRRLRADRVWLHAARRVSSRQGVEYWAVVLADAKRCTAEGATEVYGTPWLACLQAVRGGAVIFGFCNGPDRGTLGSSSGGVGGRAFVAGICEPTASRMLVDVRGRADPIRVRVRGGFFGALLPDRIDPRDVRPPHRCRG